MCVGVFKTLEAILMIRQVGEINHFVLLKLFKKHRRLLGSFLSVEAYRIM